MMGGMNQMMAGMMGGMPGAPQQQGYGQPRQPGYGQPPPQQQGYPPQQQQGYPPQQGGGGAYGNIMPPAAPPQADPMYAHFQEVAQADGKISAFELQQVLKTIGLGDYPRPGFEFQTETCRQMIAMLDKDGDMCLGFEEFKELYTALDAWKLAFQRYDKGHSGTVEHGEMNEIILNMGFNMTPAAVNVLVKRYSFKGQDQIQFDDFVAAALRVRGLSTAFKAKDRAGQGYADMSYDEFMKMVLRL